MINFRKLQNGTSISWRKKKKWVLQDKRIRAQTNILDNSAFSDEDILKFLLVTSNFFKTVPDEDYRQDELTALDGNLRGN